MRAVIADDESLTRERVRSLAGEVGIEIAGEARNGLEALDLITRHSPHLVLIDVEMPELDGFEVIAALDESTLPAVVFITAYERYAVKAFDIGAVDYLQKPITRDRFVAAIERARVRLDRSTATDRRALIEGAGAVERSRGFRSRYVVRRGSTHHFVPVSEIDWIDAADNYLQLHTGSRVHLCRGTMKQAVEELDPDLFIRVHRSNIVAAAAIRSVSAAVNGGFVLSLRNGMTIRVSRQYADRIRTLLERRA